METKTTQYNKAINKLVKAYNSRIARMLRTRPRKFGFVLTLTLFASVVAGPVLAYTQHYSLTSAYGTVALWVLFLIPMILGSAFVLVGSAILIVATLLEWIFSFSRDDVLDWLYLRMLDFVALFPGKTRQNKLRKKCTEFLQTQVEDRRRGEHMLTLTSRTAWMLDASLMLSNPHENLPSVAKDMLSELSGQVIPAVSLYNEAFVQNIRYKDEVTQKESKRIMDEAREVIENSRKVYAKVWEIQKTALTKPIDTDIKPELLSVDPIMIEQSKVLAHAATEVEKVYQEILRG